MSNANSAGKKRSSGFWARFVRRLVLCLATFLVLAMGASALAVNLVLNGPSPAARDRLTLSLSQSSATSWVPGLFLEDDVVSQICSGAAQN